eukprot:TRINITY_DN5271_c0_g1_i1.p1 TRINITY_DN5271_c0_g1~~TRINITY_DN5271_c0_g1_i1.p1  ORF type:complete len:232 (+),score=16.26 TRINITY_DN5271_c0_g1_i1:692-1387(+)
MSWKNARARPGWSTRFRSQTLGNNGPNRGAATVSRLPLPASNGPPTAVSPSTQGRRSSLGSTWPGPIPMGTSDLPPQAATARKPATNGAMRDPPPKPGTRQWYDHIVEAQLQLDNDDWAAIHSLCDAITKAGTAKDCLLAVKEPIKKFYLHKRQLRAIHIVRNCAMNCGYYAFEELVGRKWLSRLVKVGQASRPEVRASICQLLMFCEENWGAFMKRGQLEDTQDSIRKLR